MFKHDDFNFDFTNFPSINIPFSPAYGVLKQGYNMESLCRYFYGQYGDLINQYEESLYLGSFYMATVISI